MLSEKKIVKGKVMIKNCYWLMLVSLLAITGNALAEEKKKEEEKSPWTSSIELGFIRTTGNTETQTSVLKADVTYEVDRWRHNGRAEGFGQKSENDLGESVVSAERYEISGKSDYKLNERDYLFAIVKLQKDRFSGFEYEHIVSFGYGNKTIKKPTMELDLEIGPGERFFKVDDGESEKEAILRLAGKYWWAITENSKFTQELSSDIGESFTTNRSVTGIQANINKTLALKFTYTVRNKSEVPVGTEKTDTETAMTLVYSF
jgi:putative salt-induced outer membrane protein